MLYGPVFVMFQFACVEKCPEDYKNVVEDLAKETPTRTECAKDEHPLVVAMKQKNKE